MSGARDDWLDGLLPRPPRCPGCGAGTDETCEFIREFGGYYMVYKCTNPRCDRQPRLRDDQAVPGPRAGRKG